MQSPQLEKLLQLNLQAPQDPFIKFAIAQEYLKSDITDEALKMFELLVHEFPDYVGAYYHLGKLHERLGKNDAAISVYKNGITQAAKKGDFHALNELKTALSQLSEEDE